MQNDLIPILVRLSQSILGSKESNKLKLSKNLLHSLESQYFTSTNMINIATFSQLFDLLSDYYKEKFSQKIKETFFFEVQLEQRFIQIYKIIFDLALKWQETKEQYLNAILQMNEGQKTLLMQFVGQVVKREQFIQRFQEKEEENQNFVSQLSSENMLMEEKYIQLKESFDELEKKYNQLSESHNQLKNTHQKVVRENSQLKQQKLELLDDLGLHHNSGYVQIIEKYHKEINDFSKETQKFHKEIQTKTISLHQKQKQNQELILNFGQKQEILVNSYEEKLSKIFQQLNEKQQQIEKLKESQEESRFEVIRLKDVIVELRKQIQSRDSQLHQHDKIIDKFNKMKKLHLQFRKSMVQSYKNGLLMSPELGF